LAKKLVMLEIEVGADMTVEVLCVRVEDVCEEEVPCAVVAAPCGAPAPEAAPCGEAEPTA